MMTIKKAIIGVLGAFTLATTAQAGTIVLTPVPTGILPSPGEVSYSVNASGGSALLKFAIDGYKTLDGFNNYMDRFTLTLNGHDILEGSYDLGGGGVNFTYFAPVGASVSAVSYGFGNGGQAVAVVPLTLLSGVNALKFSYDGVSQGLGDEGWGLSGVTLAVPEPASWALMILGFGVVGFAMRRRTQGQSALAIG